MRNLTILIVVGFLSWMAKHFLIFPTFGEDHDISGFEFKIRF
jgi:hypothetical protein